MAADPAGSDQNETVSAALFRTAGTKSGNDAPAANSATPTAPTKHTTDAAASAAGLSADAAASAGAAPIAIAGANSEPDLSGCPHVEATRSAGPKSRGANYPRTASTVYVPNAAAANFGSIVLPGAAASTARVTAATSDADNGRTEGSDGGSGGLIQCGNVTNTEREAPRFQSAKEIEPRRLGEVEQSQSHAGQDNDGRHQ